MYKKYTRASTCADTCTCTCKPAARPDAGCEPVPPWQSHDSIQFNWFKPPAVLSTKRLPRTTALPELQNKTSNTKAKLYEQTDENNITE